MTNLQQVLSQSSKKFFGASTSRPNVGLDSSGTWLERLSSLPNDSGMRVSQKTALAHMAFYRCVTLLAGSIATQPRHLFERNGKDKSVDREHRASLLIRRQPNGYQNHYQFHFYMVVILLLWGNYYAKITRNSFYEPVAMHPIAPWLVDVRVENGKKAFYVKGERIPSSQMLHVYGLSLNGITGVNPIKYASQTLGLNLAAEKMQSSAFGKGLHAGGVIEMPEDHQGMLGSTDEQAEEYMSNVRQSFKKLYQNGSESWHEMMFLEPGWKFEQFKLNLESAQIIETRKMGIADVARFMGVPLHKVMELDKATENNIEQQGIEYVQDGVMPISMNIEAEYDTKLLRESEKDQRFFKFNLDGLMRADLKSRYEAYSIALGKNAPGFMSPEEIRDIEDLGEADENKLFKPDNMNKQNVQTNGEAA